MSDREQTKDQHAIGYWQWHPDDQKLDWSTGLFRVLGLDSTAVVPGFSRFRDLVHPEDQPHFIDPTRAPHTPAESRFRIVRPDGETRRLHQAVGVHDDAEGKPVHVVGIVRDETDGPSPVFAGEMTPELIRAARGYLDWSANELAEKANVSFSTVRRAEAAGERHLRDGSLTAIRAAFEAAGVQFIRDAEDRPGLLAG